MPVAATFVNITGSLWDTSGKLLTVGLLTFTPTRPIANGSHLVAAKTVIPIAGPVTFALSPSFGIPYTVELDPNPTDTATPTPLKAGYFKKTILVPSAGMIDLASLLN